MGVVPWTSGDIPLAVIFLGGGGVGILSIFTRFFTRVSTHTACLVNHTSETPGIEYMSISSVP